MVRLSAVVLLVLLGPVQAAHAYVLPADYLMRMLADKRQSLKIRDLSAQIESEYNGSHAIVDERLYMKAPERLRVVGDDDTTPRFVQREGDRAELDGKELERVVGPPTHLLADLLMPAGKNLDDMVANLMHVLQSAGIDTSLVTLGRDNGNPVYIIGAHSWEPNKPQLWIDKGSHLPVHYVVYDQPDDKGHRCATDLEEFGSSATGNWLPRVIERQVDGKLVWRATVTQVEVNQRLPETLFDVPN